MQDAYDMAIESAAAAGEGGVPAWEAEGWLLAGMARAWTGENGITELRRGLDVALACGDPGSVGHGYLFLVDMLGLAGRRAESLALAEEGIQTADRLGIAATHGSDLRGDAGLLLIDDGRWPAAASVLEPADPRAIPSLARALLAIRRGDLALADDELVATTIGPSIGGRGIRGGPLELARAELAWIRGDRETAVREIESVPLSSTVWGLDFAAWRALWLARLGVDTGEAPRPRHPNDALDRALEAEIAAELPGGDVAGWDRAAVAWSALGWPYHEGWARLRQAEAGFTARDRETARAALDEAIRIADLLGAGPLRDRGPPDGRASWLVRPVASPPTRRSLTSRSGKSSALAEGRTNRQIAEALFLSAKTVGSEVVVGEGMLGLAAARRSVVRVTNLALDRVVARAVRSGIERRGEESSLEKEIALPGLPDARSQHPSAAPRAARGGDGGPVSSWS
jgi:hypothetical protein